MFYCMYYAHLVHSKMVSKSLLENQDIQVIFRIPSQLSPKSIQVKVKTKTAGNNKSNPDE